jgi:DNA invertase Pin-like site-specific DNA recombinase
MKKTTLEEKLAIRDGIECGKSYQEIADALGLTHRVVLKWGQKVKKKCLFMSCYGSRKVWLT